MTPIEISGAPSNATVALPTAAGGSSPPLRGISMSAIPADRPATRPLDYLPVSLFGSVMGLTGLSVAWRLAHARFGVPSAIAEAVAALAVLAFVAVTIAYLTKTLQAPAAVRSEFAHPIAGSLFGTILISLLLVPIVIAPVSLAVARAFWVVGAAGMLVFALLMVDRWMSNRQMAEHATPAWIIPVVGLLDVPLAMPFLELPPLHGLMVLCLAVGLFFAVPLFTMIFARLLFETPLPGPLQPTLMILVAPFAVGVSTYVTTTGSFDLFAQGLYALTLFLLVVLIGRMRFVVGACPFRVTWWAVSFPLAACAIASLRVATMFPSELNDGVAIALLAGTSLVIAWLLVRTLVGIAKGELRRLA
jgi:tellurite resistance protein